MADITLSAGVRQNLLSLQNTASLMAQTQNRLATGKKVNSALDNPLNYFTSQSLGNRASDLTSLLDSIGNAVQTITAADKGITSLTKLVQTAQAIAQQTLQAATTTAKVTGTVAGLTVGDEKYGALRRLIASTRIWIFIPSRILKFFETPTSNFKKRWLRRPSTVNGKFLNEIAETLV